MKFSLPSPNLLLFNVLCVALIFVSAIGNGKLPRVADPNFPPLPNEFQLKVDQSCRNLLYIEMSFWASASDQKVISAFGGCLQVERGFCKSAKPCFPRHYNATMYEYFYHRTTSGFWIAVGIKREYKSRCNEPAYASFISDMFINLHRSIKKFSHLKKFESTLSTSKINVTEIRGSLPRLPDLTVPSPLPKYFTSRYPVMCRYFWCVWNDNYKIIPDSDWTPGHIGLFIHWTFYGCTEKICDHKERIDSKNMIKGKKRMPANRR